MTVVRTLADLEREAAGLRELLDRKRREVPSRHFGVHTLIDALTGRLDEVTSQCGLMREDEPPCEPEAFPSSSPRPC